MGFGGEEGCRRSPGHFKNSFILKDIIFIYKLNLLLFFLIFADVGTCNFLSYFRCHSGSHGL